MSNKLFLHITGLDVESIVAFTVENKLTSDSCPDIGYIGSGEYIGDVKNLNDILALELDPLTRIVTVSRVNEYVSIDETDQTTYSFTNNPY